MSSAFSYFFDLSKKTMDTLVPVLAKMLEGMLTTPRSIWASTIFLRIARGILPLAVRKPVGTTTAACPSSSIEATMCWRNIR